MHGRQFTGDALTELRCVAQRSRFDATQNALGLLDELVELFAGVDVQFAEVLKELANVLDGRVSEDFRLSIFGAAEPLGQMRHEPAAHLFEKGGLGELHRFVESGGDALAHG